MKISKDSENLPKTQQQIKGREWNILHYIWTSSSA